MSYVRLLSGSLELSTYGSACYDIRTTISEQRLLYPGTTYKLPTGVTTELDGSLAAIIKEKSGLAADGLAVHGGVIDSDYRQEWMVIVSVRRPVTIKPSQKIAQVLFVAKPEIERYGEGWIYDNQERVSGFGSTGL